MGEVSASKLLCTGTCVPPCAIVERLRAVLSIGVAHPLAPINHQTVRSWPILVSG